MVKVANPGELNQGCSQLDILVCHRIEVCTNLSTPPLTRVPIRNRQVRRGIRRTYLVIDLIDQVDSCVRHICPCGVPEGIFVEKVGCQ